MEMDEKDEAGFSMEDTAPGEVARPKVGFENIVEAGDYVSGVYNIDLDLAHPRIE